LALAKALAEPGSPLLTTDARFARAIAVSSDVGALLVT
jgi:hypothetical protein